MDLRVHIESSDTGATVVVAVGSVDISSRDALAQAAQKALVDGATVLALDLSGVTFIDSTGIGTLVGLASDSADHGARFVLRDPSRPVRRTLEVAGLADQWADDGAAEL